MAALTFGQLCDEVAFRVGTGGNATDDSRTTIKRCLNWAAREVWNGHSWPERMVEAFVATVAPYETGTVTLTSGSATITGSGTTFTSDMVGRRFAISTIAPWYRILTYSSATSIALDRVYTEANAAGQAFTIYADELALSTSIESIVDVSVMTSSGTHGRLELLEQRQLDDGATVPVSRGKPLYWTAVAPLSTATSTRRIRVWPVPDAAYNVRVRGLSFWTDMSSEGGTPSFHADREALVVYGACLMFRRGTDETAPLDDFYEKVADAAGKTKAVRPWVGRRLPFDAPSGVRSRRFGSVSP